MTICLIFGFAEAGPIPISNYCQFCVGNADSVLYLIIIVEVIYFASFVVLSLSLSGRDRRDRRFPSGILCVMCSVWRDMYNVSSVLCCVLVLYNIYSI